MGVWGGAVRCLINSSRASANHEIDIAWAVRCDRANECITSDQCRVPDTRRRDQEAVAGVFVACIGDDFRSLKRDPLLDRYDPRFCHLYSIPKPPIGGFLAEMRPPGNPHFLRCNGQFPGRDGRNQQRSGLLRRRDRYLGVFAERVLTTNQPVERMGVEKDASQCSAVRIGGSVVAHLHPCEAMGLVRSTLFSSVNCPFSAPAPRNVNVRPDLGSRTIVSVFKG